MARISRTGTTDSTGVASTTVTGSGGGRLKFISRNGGLWSNSYEVDDYLLIDTGVTANKQYNITLNDCDFYLEFTVHPTASTGAVARLLFRQDSTQYLNIGDLFSNANCGLQWSYGGATSSFYGKGIYVDVDTKVTLTRTGTLMVLTVGDSTYNISNCPLTFNYLEMAVVSNNSINDLKLYRVFSKPKHYTPIALSSSASIIQTGESATLSAELTNVLGEKLASKSVNFIEKVEHLYEHTDEVSQVYNSGQNVTVLSPSISRTDLGTSWTLSFDMKTDCESRVFIGDSASAIPTNPQYSIFMGRDISNVISYGYRTTTTTVSASSVASTSYHSCKIVFNNGTITYYVDDTQVGTKTVSFYGNYDNYVVGLVAWGTGTLYAKNIVLDNENGGDILIGTGTSNSQGIATCNITGTGKGERQFIASSSSILSETYTIMDKP